MARYVIFDLSEVLISGLPGIEKPLAQELSLPEREILPCFAGELMERLCLGGISEEAYLRRIIEREGWDVGIPRLKEIIRGNFHRQVDGVLSILMDLSSRYQLALHSDHVREWIPYIKSIHPFMRVFQRAFFSYELGKLKHDPKAFLKVLDGLAVPPRQCLFIDDNPKNVQAAGSVGIRSIRFLESAQLLSELREFGLLN